MFPVVCCYYKHNTSSMFTSCLIKFRMIYSFPFFSFGLNAAQHVLHRCLILKVKNTAFFSHGLFIWNIIRRCFIDMSLTSKECKKVEMTEMNWRIKTLKTQSKKLLSLTRFCRFTDGISDVDTLRTLCWIHHVSHYTTLKLLNNLNTSIYLRIYCS